MAYLFGLKLLYPNKVFLLRGNHETRDVNGWEEHYKEKSFLFQCKMRFGNEKGDFIWEECNKAFDRLPLSAVIDHEIFCIHGGIPRPVSEHRNEVQAILSVPNVASVMPAYDHESEWTKQVTQPSPSLIHSPCINEHMIDSYPLLHYTFYGLTHPSIDPSIYSSHSHSMQVCSDCIWSDPASDEMERTLDETGFGDSPRGNTCRNQHILITHPFNTPINTPHQHIL